MFDQAIRSVNGSDKVEAEIRYFLSRLAGNSSILSVRPPSENDSSPFGSRAACGGKSMRAKSATRPVLR